MIGYQKKNSLQQINPGLDIGELRFSHETFGLANKS